MIDMLVPYLVGAITTFAAVEYGRRLERHHPRRPKQRAQWPMVPPRTLGDGHEAEPKRGTTR